MVAEEETRARGYERTLRRLWLTNKKILRDSLLERLNRLRSPRAGSIFNEAEEIAQEWLLRDMLGEKTDDIPVRLEEAREKRDNAMMEGALR